MTWMELDSSMFRKIGQAEKDNIKWCHSCVEYNNKEKLKGKNSRILTEPES